MDAMLLAVCVNDATYSTKQSIDLTLSNGTFPNQQSILFEEIRAAKSNVNQAMAYQCSGGSMVHSDVVFRI